MFYLCWSGIYSLCFKGLPFDYYCCCTLEHIYVILSQKQQKKLVWRQCCVVLLLLTQYLGIFLLFSLICSYLISLFLRYCRLTWNLFLSSSSNTLTLLPSSLSVFSLRLINYLTLFFLPAAVVCMSWRRQSDE